MRADMAKVIVERPRYASAAPSRAKGYRRQLARDWPENVPRREGMKRRCRGGTKAFNEHLGPLRRYLESNVGRPWDKVYSEICANIDRGSVVQKHILTHVFDYVSVHVVLLDGALCHGEGRMYGRPLGDFRTSYYVCPRTRLLRRLESGNTKKFRRRPKRAEPHRHVRLNERQICCSIDGVWHLVQVKPFPPESEWIPHQFLQSRGIYDPVRGQSLTAAQARKLYGARVVGVSSRRLGKREMRQLPIPIDWQQ